MNKALLFMIGLIAVSVSSTGVAYFDLTKPGEKPREMNGISFDEYKDFTDKWHLVTVRYRLDTGEQRFTYANDLAFSAMQSLKPDYPNGAAFAKVAFSTESDPSFPSSKLPAGARRYQFMLKDKKKYPDSDGWGYALFDADGNLFNEDMKTKTSSCVACHRVVPERNYVFSRKMQLSWDSKISANDFGALDKIVKFEMIRSKNTPKLLNEALKGFEQINSLVGELQKHAFSGTLDEIVPLLTEKAKATSIPSALIVDKNFFSAVIPQPAKKCDMQMHLQFYRIVVLYNSKLVRDAGVCL
jgi:hypothetical protein